MADDNKETVEEQEPIGIFDLDAPEVNPDVTFVEGGEPVPFDDEVEEEEETAADEVEETEEEGDEVIEDEEEVVEEDEESATEEESSPDAEEEGSADAPTETTAEAATTSTESAPPAPESEPLSFKADGREFTVAGRKDEDGNIIIAPDEWNRSIQPRLADRAVWRSQREAYERQIAALDPNSNPEVVRAREITKSFKELLEKGPDAVVEWAENYHANREVLMAQAEAAAARAEADALRQGRNAEDGQRQTAELITQMDEGLENLLNRASELEPYKGLDMAHVKRVLQPMKAAIFFRAQQDMPDAGLKAGEIGINLQVVDNVLKAEAEREAAYKARLSTNKAASAAKKRNEKVLGKPKAPPVSTEKSVAGQGAKAPKKAKTVEDWESNLTALARG